MNLFSDSSSDGGKILAEGFACIFAFYAGSQRAIGIPSIDDALEMI